MTAEEFKRAIKNIPTVSSEVPISSMYAIDVEELLKAIEQFKKVPTYDELLKDNNRLRAKLDELEKSNNQ